MWRGGQRHVSGALERALHDAQLPTLGLEAHRGDNAGNEIKRHFFDAGFPMCAGRGLGSGGSVPLPSAPLNSSHLLAAPATLHLVNIIRLSTFGLQCGAIRVFYWIIEKLTITRYDNQYKQGLFQRSGLL